MSFQPPKKGILSFMTVQATERGVVARPDRMLSPKEQNLMQKLAEDLARIGFGKQ